VNFISGVMLGNPSEEIEKPETTNKKENRKKQKKPSGFMNLALRSFF